MAGLPLPAGRMTVPDPQTGQPRAAPYDPYTAIRTLDLRAPLLDDPRFAPYVVNEEAGYGTDHGVGGGQVWSPGGRTINQHALPPELREAFYEAQARNQTADWTFGEGWRSGALTPYQSKYEQITPLGNGMVSVRMQRPGMHKYDTMDAVYKLDPATGQYTLQGDPQARREVSSMQSMGHDAVDAAAKFVLPSLAMYGAATAFGPGAGAGEAGAFGEGVAGAGGSSAGELTAKELLYGNAGYGPGLSGWQTSVYDGVMGVTGSGPFASVMSGSNVSGGLSSLAGSAFGGGGAGGAMAGGGWLGDLIGIYGLYQNQRAMDRAQGQTDRALDMTGRAADRQAQLAELQFANYMDKIQPGLLSDAAWARERAKVVAGQSDKLYADQVDDAGFYRDRWRGVQVPLEDQIIAQAKELGAPAEQERQAGLALADVRGQGAMMRDAMARRNASMGINPASASAMALAQDAFTAEGLAGAGAMTTARASAKDRGRAALMDAAALGRGLPGFSASSYGGANSASGTGLQAGSTPAQAGATTAGAMNSSMANVGNLWANAANAATGGANVANMFANTMNNSALSTLAGYGLGRSWWQPPRNAGGGG